MANLTVMKQTNQLSGKAAFIMLIASAYIFPTAANALSDCGEILRLGLYNTQYQTSTTDANNIALSQLCSYDYSLNSSTSSGSVEAGASFFGIFGGSAGGASYSQQIIAAQKQYCTKGFNSSTYSSSSSSFAQQLYQGSITAWSQCNTLQSRGLVVNIDTSPDFAVTNVSLSWPATSGPVFKGLYVPTNTAALKGSAVCSIAINGGKNVIASANTTFPLNGSVDTFNCSRVFYTDSAGNAFSNATRLSFNTSEGNIDVDLPPIGKLTSQSVAQILNQVTTLQNKVSALNTSTPIACSPSTFSNPTNSPKLPNYTPDIYSCNINTPSKGVLFLSFDGVITGNTCTYTMFLDGQATGIGAFTEVTSSVESAHGSLAVNVASGAHTLSVRSTGWHDTNTCYLAGGGITGMFVPKL